MKTSAKITLKNIVFIIIVITGLAACVNAEKKQADSYNTEADNNSCIEVPSWFPHSQTPAPKEGTNSLFALDTTNNIIFHQWSWQKFLWLTKPKSSTDNTPLFLNNESKVIQVTSHMLPIEKQEGAEVVLTDTIQAGFPKGVLRTNPSYLSATNKKSYTVHYSIHVSTIMMDAAKKFSDSINKKIAGFDAAKATFPVGSLELKVSWVNADAIPSDKLTNYYTTIGAIQNKDSTYTNTKVAMLGMHVVGVVQNHPEFIWATFENNDLAPNYNWPNDNASSTTEKLLFRKGKTSGVAGITYANDKADSLSRAFDLFHYGVPRNANGLYSNTSQEEPINFNNIKNINACVKKHLDKSDVWSNYFYNGSIWIDTDKLTRKKQAELIVSLGGSIANATTGSSARGSLNSANVTMETFTQTFESTISEIAVGNLVNCFTCHNSSSSPLNLSHIFEGYVARKQGVSASQVEKDKAKREVLEYMKNK